MNRVQEAALDRDEKVNGKLTDNLKPAEMVSLRSHLLPILLKYCGVTNGDLEQAVPGLQDQTGEEPPARQGRQVPLLRLGLEGEDHVNWLVVWLLCFVGMLAIDWVCHLLGKPTLTRAIVTHVPWWLGMGFFTWAWVHFCVWYWRAR